MIYPPGMSDTDLSPEQLLQMQEAVGMVVIDMEVVEGQTVTLPVTNKSMTLNLTASGPLQAVNIILPGNADGMVGQRVFANSSVEISVAMFSSTNLVNNAQYMFNPGDNCVFYRNKPGTWSRITS